MSFHFTQFCAFISYSFVFMGYYLWFIEAKVHNFSEVQGIWCVFSSVIDTAFTFSRKSVLLQRY